MLDDVCLVFRSYIIWCEIMKEALTRKHMLTIEVRLSEVGVGEQNKA